MQVCADSCQQTSVAVAGLMAACAWCKDSKLPVDVAQSWNPVAGLALDAHCRVQLAALPLVAILLRLSTSGSSTSRLGAQVVQTAAMCGMRFPE